MGKVQPKKTLEDRILNTVGLTLRTVVSAVTHVGEYVSYRTDKGKYVNRNARKEARRQR